MKRVNKGAKRRLLLFFTVFVVLFGYMSFTTFKYWKQILMNKNEQKQLEEEYNNLVKEEDTLESDLIKLQDPEYVAKYAREKYLYTKDGELIIKIIDENE